MNFCFFLFGYSHLFYKKLIDQDFFSKKFKVKNIFFIAPNRTHQLFYEKNNFAVTYLTDLSIESSNYNVNCLELASQKKSIINYKSSKQEDLYMTWNLFYSQFLQLKKIDVVIFNQAIEGLAGILLAKNAKKLDIQCFVPHMCRFIKKSFFSINQYENLELRKSKPEKALPITIKTIDQIRENKFMGYEYVHIKKIFFLKRYFLFIKKIFFQKNSFDLPRIKVSIENNLSYLYKIKYEINKLKSKKYFNLSSIKGLNQKYIFYPLQYTPESSINIPNAYFVDQERLIDLIRFNMPEDFILIVKEHPSMYGRRSSKFFKKLSKKSSTRIISPKISSNLLIKNASLVVSVSGTACFEAYILKIPSLVFGKTFFDMFTNIYGIDYNDLNQTLKKYIKRDITDKDVNLALNLIFQNTYDFVCGGVDFDKNILSNENINNFIKSLDKELNLRLKKSWI